jgi:hypothetical protein
MSAVACPAARTSRTALVERGVLEAIAYADVFDYPLTAVEVHRYLVGVDAAPAEVTAALRSPALRRWLAACEGYFALAGRQPCVALRRERAARAAGLWPRARAWARAIAALPFVRFVGVSGALAVDNVEAGADIDYFIVVETGRLWTVRGAIVLLVRWAARRGDVLCPNYLVSDRALELDDRSLFTAHELAQLVPIAGLDVYSRLRRANAWTARLLPNARGAPRDGLHVVAAPRLATRLAERVGRTRPLDRVEHWEMARKIRRLGAGVWPLEVRLDADRCKGHFSEHGDRVRRAFEHRLAALEGAP